MRILQTNPISIQRKTFTSSNITKYHTNLESAPFNKISFTTLVSIFNEKFKNQPSVKIYDIGCSDGTLSYGLAINLIKNLKENAKKFLPILAIDNDEYIIEYAKQRFLNLTGIEEGIISLGNLHFLQKFLTKLDTRNDYASINNECKNSQISYSEARTKREQNRIEAKKHLLDGEFVKILKFDSLGLPFTRKFVDKDFLIDYFSTYKVSEELTNTVSFQNKEAIEILNEIIRAQENKKNEYIQELNSWAKTNECKFSINEYIKILEYPNQNTLSDIAQKNNFTQQNPKDKINPKELAKAIPLNSEKQSENLSNKIVEDIINNIAEELSIKNKIIILRNIQPTDRTKSILEQKNQCKEFNNILNKALVPGDIIIVGDTEKFFFINEFFYKFKEISDNIYEVVL